MSAVGGFDVWLASSGLHLSPEQRAAFDAFEDALYLANEQKNLTRIPREECWVRHFVDSLLFQDLIPEGSSLLDIGTGPGFPAWPLARARPDLSVTALDSNGKMLAFLQQHLLPNLRVVQARAEEGAVRDSFDVVTGRAVAPLPAQLEISAPSCRVGGLVIPMRGPSDALDSTSGEELGLRLTEVHQRELPGGAVRVFPVYRKERPTPKRFPRRWAEIRADRLA